MERDFKQVSLTPELMFLTTLLSCFFLPPQTLTVTLWNEYYHLLLIDEITET